jgi:Flp pilus assembly pilin Flp
MISIVALIRRLSNSRFSARALRVLRSFVRDEAGQATVEYILLLAGIVGGSALVSRAFGTSFTRGILSLGSVLEKDLRTGRVDVTIWRN